MLHQRARGCRPALIGIAVLPLALAGCAAELDAAPSPSPETTVSVVGGPCQDLFDAAVVQDASLESATEMYVKLTNTGTELCALSGFASEVALVRDAHPLTISYSGPEHVDAAGRATSIVDVAPGASAYFWLEITHLSEPTTACTDSIQSTDLRLTLPGAAVPVFAPALVDLCVDTDPKYRYGPIDTEPRPA